MSEKPIDWRGSSLDDLKKLFSVAARKEAGHQLSQVQAGLDPDHWKPFETIGPGGREIIVNVEDGWYRMMYVAKFEESIYVLHCFQKKTNATSKKDVKIATARYAAVVAERKKK